jgi:hypothetical protein
MATRSTARISASVIGSRLCPVSPVFRPVAGLVKIRPRFLANRNSDRSAAMVVRSWWRCSASSMAWTSARVTSRRWPWSADQYWISGWTALK